VLSPAAGLTDTGQSQEQGQRPKEKGLRLSGVGSHPRHPSIETARVPSNKGDLTAPGRQRQTQPPTSAHPASRRTFRDRGNPNPPQARTGKTTRTSRPPSVGSKTPPPPHLRQHGKGQPAPEPGPEP